MNYEQSFWAGTQDVRLCGDCNFRMTQLFMSWVCDRCEPPTSASAHEPVSGSAISTPETCAEPWYVYSSRANLTTVSGGYNLYTRAEFTYLFDKCVRKAKKAKSSYYIYEITDDGTEDYADVSPRRPISTREVAVAIHTVVP